MRLCDHVHGITDAQINNVAENAVADRERVVITINKDRVAAIAAEIAAADRDEVVITTNLQSIVSVTNQLNIAEENGVVTAEDIEAIVVVVTERRIADTDGVAHACGINIEAIVIAVKEAIFDRHNVVDAINLEAFFAVVSGSYSIKADGVATTGDIKAIVSVTTQHCIEQADVVASTCFVDIEAILSAAVAQGAVTNGDVVVSAIDFKPFFPVVGGSYSIKADGVATTGDIKAIVSVIAQRCIAEYNVVTSTHFVDIEAIFGAAVTQGAVTDGHNVVGAINLEAFFPVVGGRYSIKADGVATTCKVEAIVSVTTQRRVAECNVVASTCFVNIEAIFGAAVAQGAVTDGHNVVSAIDFKPFFPVVGGRYIAQSNSAEIATEIDAITRIVAEDTCQCLDVVTADIDTISHKSNFLPTFFENFKCSSAVK